MKVIQIIFIFIALQCTFQSSKRVHSERNSLNKKQTQKKVIFLKPRKDGDDHSHQIEQQKQTFTEIDEKEDEEQKQKEKEKEKQKENIKQKEEEEGEVEEEAEEEEQKKDQAWMRVELNKLIKSQTNLSREIQRFYTFYNMFQEQKQTESDFKNSESVWDLTQKLNKIKNELEIIETKSKNIETEMIAFHNQELDVDKEDLEAQNKQRKTFLRLIKKVKAVKRHLLKHHEELDKDFSRLEQEANAIHKGQATRFKKYKKVK